jgi:electron transport complex protein RnfE
MSENNKNGHSNLYEFTKGIIKENPVLVTLLGMCPTLAVTTMASNGIGMGLATTFVLVCSNLVISLLKNVIPKAVRLPCFIVVIAAFVTLIEFLMEGYLPALYDSLGLFLSLITVNCIILGRAEAFASKNNPLKSVLDGLGNGLGFTLALFLMGSLREIFGAGEWFGIDLHLPVTMTVFIMPAGGFFTLGVIVAVVNKLASKKPPQELGCAACPNASSCPSFNGNTASATEEGGKE